MKKLLFTMAALLLLALPSSAMSYEAYELNLSEAQYEAAYEINLDYLMSINTVDDLAGNYWRWRNLDMSYVLLEWQYRAFCDAAYFYRPLYWDTGCWHFAIYARYPHRDYYYFGRPTFYGVYRGDHAWHHNGGRSWYHGRHYGGPGPRGGMRDGFGRGDFGQGYRYRQDHRPYNGSQPYGGVQGRRESSTRTTVRRPNPNGSQQRPSASRRYNGSGQYGPATGVQRTSPSSPRSFGGSRSNPSQPRSTFTAPTRPSRPTPSSPRSGSPRGGGNSGGSHGSFGGHR